MISSPEFEQPDVEDNRIVNEHFIKTGFVHGKPIQPRQTAMVNIAPDEKNILASMKSKTRYNIRLAKRKGITIRFASADDLPAFHAISKITAERNKFSVHSLEYYQTVFRTFPAEYRALLLAEYEGQLLAGIMVFAWEKTAYYLYGASNNEHRNRMPTYLLQWEAMCWAKKAGCERYDLWGIPDAPFEKLEAGFKTRNDGLWGVYRFKRGFAGDIVRSVGAFDYVYKPLHYMAFKRFSG